MTTDMSLQYSTKLIDQIKAIDPNYRFQTPGVPMTLDGQMSEIANLRLDRAAAFYRVRGETAPLEVEMLRFIQKRTDSAYDAGVRLYEEGKTRRSAFA